MSGHYTRLYAHLVWTVRGRQPLLSPEVCQVLWPHIAATARKLGAQPVAVGGVADHLHVALTVPPTESVAHLVQRLKGASSRLLNMEGIAGFRWQEGYGAQSFGHDGWPAVAAYIANQPAHHRHGDLRPDLEATAEHDGT